MKKFVFTAVALILSVAGCSKSADEPNEAAGAEDVSVEIVVSRTPAPEGAAVFIKQPTDGAQVTSPFIVEFGASGLTIVPAGDDTPASGHHHLLINAEMPNVSLPIPANNNYLHFGKGHTQTELSLAPGSYSLQLLAGDHLHIPHDPAIASEVINVTVIEQ